MGMGWNQSYHSRKIESNQINLKVKLRFHSLTKQITSCGMFQSKAKAKRPTYSIPSMENTLNLNKLNCVVVKSYLNHKVILLHDRPS